MSSQRGFALFIGHSGGGLDRAGRSRKKEEEEEGILLGILRSVRVLPRERRDLISRSIFYCQNGLMDAPVRGAVEGASVGVGGGGGGGSCWGWKKEGVADRVTRVLDIDATATGSRYESRWHRQRIASTTRATPARAGSSADRNRPTPGGRAC